MKLSHDRVHTYLTAKGMSETDYEKLEAKVSELLAEKAKCKAIIDNAPLKDVNVYKEAAVCFAKLQENIHNDA
jgi:hypothetical protein